MANKNTSININQIVFSLLTLNYTNELQPIDDFYNQTGFLELDSNNDLMPIIENEKDLFLELDNNNDIQPKNKYDS